MGDHNNHGIIVETMNTSATSENDIIEAQAEEDPYHKKLRRRKRRKRRMVVCGAAGATAVTVFCGPTLVGGMVGGAVGAAGARVVSKRKERQKDERLARERTMMST